MNHFPVAKPPSGFASKLFRIVLFALFARLSASAQIIEYPFIAASEQPEKIICAPDNAYWIAEFTTEYNVGVICRVDTNGNVTQPYLVPSNTSPCGMVLGPDSNIWFTEAAVDKIARINRGTNGAYTNGTVTEFPIHPGVLTNSQPYGITTGPDGNLWFTEYQNSIIGVMNTNGQMLHEYGAGIFRTNSQFRDIAAGPDGALWFTEQTFGTIGHITTSGAITEIPFPSATNIYSNSEPLDIIAGPDGAMWFTEASSNRIGRLTTSFSYSDYVLPTVGAYSGYNYSQVPYGLTIGSDGNIWFTEFIGYNVSRLDIATGVITEFPTTSPGSGPAYITSGPDKNIWFGEYANNAVAQFVLPTLSIALNTNGQYVLTWPSTATDYVLQGNTNLASTNWIDITSPTAVATTNLLIYTNVETNLQFFRLFQTTIP